MKKLLQWFNKYLKFIALGIIVLLALFSLMQCSKNSDLSRENEKLKLTESILSNNLKVANDTMRFWKDKAGRSMSEISILTATNDLLNTQYSDVYAKYKSMVGKEAKSSELIAYLTAQIVLKDQIIQYLKDRIAGSGSYILNDSTVVINVGKIYDSLNYYLVNGCVETSIKDNKIIAGKVDLTTTLGIGLEFGLNRDKKTGIASVTSRTAFPAKVTLGGITKIEEELNKKPALYLGLGVVVGYGATLEKQPQLLPYIGVAAYLSPRWLTIKIHNK